MVFLNNTQKNTTQNLKTVKLKINQFIHKFLKVSCINRRQMTDQRKIFATSLQS